MNLDNSHRAQLQALAGNLFYIFTSIRIRMITISQSRPRKRILKIRPGHLANFSGGAGYMPFIPIFSIPASFLFGIIGSLILHSKGKSVASVDNNLDEPLRRTALIDFVRYAHYHLKVCILLSVFVGAVLYFFGLSMVYDFKYSYLILGLIYAVGPLVAWVLSTWWLVRLICQYGSRGSNLFYAGVAHVLIIIGLFFTTALFAELANEVP